jgi:FlaG/FlaF family flagellin (archaellin)
MTDKIEAQTQALSDQLKKCNEEKTNEEVIKELEKYQQMVKEADFSVEAQAASKKKKVSKKDKFFAPKINRITRAVNKLNDKVVVYKEKKLAEEAERKKCQK